MRKMSFLTVCLSLIAMFISSSTVLGAELKPIQLLKPQTSGGKPLMQALAERKSMRVFSNKKLSVQTLSNLLWAAFGINRAEGKKGKRTAPSACNWQEIDIYVALEDGLYLYDAPANILKPVLAKDLRVAAGIQNFTQDAPVNLIYVADLTRMGNRKKEVKDFYSATDTGFISQNVYLFCASEGLATVVLGYVDKSTLAKLMGLNSDQRIILTQPVGYPK